MEDKLTKGEIHYTKFVYVASCNLVFQFLPFYATFRGKGTVLQFQPKIVLTVSDWLRMINKGGIES